MADKLSVQQLQEIAKQAQEKRRKAGLNISVGSSIKLPLKELTQLYMPDCVGKNATYHAYWGLDTEIDRTAKMGYEPVLDEKGELLRYNNMVAWKIPIDIYKQQLAQNVEISKAMVGDTDSKTASDYVQQQESAVKNNPLIESEELTSHKATKQNMAKYK